MVRFLSLVFRWAQVPGRLSRLFSLVRTSIIPAALLQLFLDMHQSVWVAASEGRKLRPDSALLLGLLVAVLVELGKGLIWQRQKQTYLFINEISVFKTYLSCYWRKRRGEINQSGKYNVTGMAVPLPRLSLFLFIFWFDGDVCPAVSSGGAFLCSAQHHEKVPVPAASQSKGRFLKVAIACLWHR